MRLRATERLVELTSGVDAFYLSGEGSLPVALVDDLTRAREAARGSHSETPFDLGSETFRVSWGGLQRYGFRLDHLRGVIAFTVSDALPAVRVQPRASFLHAVGVESAVRWFTDIVESVLGAVTWKASRVDLFMDSHGWDLDSNDRDRFVCRASQRVVFEEDAMFTGLRFGSGKSGAVMARIYDKTEESRQKGTDWWPAKWGDAYRPGERVLRVEFQVGRDLMREVGVSSPEDVLREVSGLWGYLTDQWLTYRVPSLDSTRSRWQIAPEWQAIQSANLRGGAVGLDRVYAGEVAGSMRRLLPALRGYLASAGALLGATNLEETLHRVSRYLVRDEELTGIRFADRILEKRVARGLA